MTRKYTPDVPYYEHNPNLPVLEVRVGDVIFYRGILDGALIEHFGIVTKVTHVLNFVHLQFDGYPQKDHTLHKNCTVELHGYVSEQALTRIFQSQRNDEPLD